MWKKPFRPYFGANILSIFLIRFDHILMTHWPLKVKFWFSFSPNSLRLEPGLAQNNFPVVLPRWLFIWLFYVLFNTDYSAFLFSISKHSLSHSTTIMYHSLQSVLMHLENCHQHWGASKGTELFVSWMTNISHCTLVTFWTARKMGPNTSSLILHLKV